MTTTPSPRIWLTYAWADNSQGDFNHLVQKLRTVGVEANYDKIAIIPGRRLWEQIADRITNQPINGWGYLLTANSLASEPCREELAYALERALNSKGGTFPLIGLLHGVRIEDVPAALRVRLCVNLASPSWTDELKAGLEGRPPAGVQVEQSQYVWVIHRGYGGLPSQTAVEVRPRFGEIMFWRFLVPQSASIVSWGHGPANGGGLSLGQRDSLETQGVKFYGAPVHLFGAGDRLSPGVSAYVIFAGQPPDFVVFGVAAASQEPLMVESSVETLELRANDFTRSLLGGGATRCDL